MTLGRLFAFYSHPDYSHILKMIPAQFKGLAKSKGRLFCFELWVDEAAVRI